MVSDKTPEIILTKQEALDFLYAPRRTSKNDPLGHIIYFYEAISAKCITKDETSEFIAASFKKYIDKAGEITLDEAFGLKSVPRAGNPAKYYKKQNEDNEKYTDLAKLIAKGKTQREAATILLQKETASNATIEEIDSFENEIDALIKGFNRWPLRKHIFELIKNMFLSNS